MLVGPYPPCTQTSAAATGIFEGGVGNPTSTSTIEDHEQIELIDEIELNEEESVMVWPHLHLLTLVIPKKIRMQMKYMVHG